MEEAKLRKKKQKMISTGNPANVASICRDLGDHYSVVGRYEDAIAEYKEASELYKQLKKPLETAKAHRMVSEMYMLCSKFENALKYANFYLKNVQRLNNKAEEQRAYATIGRVHLLQGQSLNDCLIANKPLKNAEKAFLQSLLVCRELPGKVNKIELIDMQTRLYLNIGVVKEHMEDFEQSIMYIDKAVKMCGKNDLHELLHLCYVSASLLYFYKLSDSLSALRYINLALEEVKYIPNRIKKECESLLIKAEFFVQSGDFYSAKQVLLRAYKLKSPDENDKQNIENNLKVVAALCRTLDSLVTTSSIDYKMQKILYEKMGDGCCVLENYTKAIDYYLKMLECAKNNCEPNNELAPIYVSLYQTYKDKKDYVSALNYLWMEFEVNKNDPVEAFHTLSNIAEVCELQSMPFWTIHDLYHKAIDQAQKAKNRKLEKIGLVRLMKLQQKFNMHIMVENLKEQASNIGIDLNYDSDDENDVSSERNIPDIGEDICLEDLTDSDNESGKISTQRAKRKRRPCLTIKRNYRGETELHQACISGNLTLVQRLISQGHAVNVRDHAGWLPLHEACIHGHKQIVEFLLKNGCLNVINDKGGTHCDGITPLYDACSNGFLDVAKLLLNYGAKAKITTDFGDNPLSSLTKWHSTKQLNESEQCLYEDVRTKLINQLIKSGDTDDAKYASSSHTFTMSPSKKVSSNRHKKFFYEDDDEPRNSEQDQIYFENDSQENVTSFESVAEDFALPCNENNKQSRLKSFSILKPTSQINNKASYAQEYKKVMESVKHPNRKYSHLNTITEPTIKKLPGYLDPNEIDADWLEDDTGSHKKKKKYFCDKNISAQRTHNSNNESIKKISLSKELYEIGSESDNYQNSLLPSLNTNPRKTQSYKTRHFTCKKTEKQSSSSILQTRFSRFKGYSDSNDKKTETNLTIISNTNTSPIVSQDILQIHSSVAPSISFKIKVENELLLVPVDRRKVNEVNIYWLAEEASRRYYNLVGIKPVLRLTTLDGFVFEGTDCVSVAVQENMISSKVLDWKAISFSQRYEEVCNQINHPVDSGIKSILGRSQTLNTLSFNDHCLSLEATQPVFKALLHQKVLFELDLSNSFIQDDGCRQLSTALISLRQLKVLKLQGNCITVDGLTHMNLVLKNNSFELEELYLSSNPLGDKSLRSLETLCQSLAKLKKLNISSCSIRNFYNFDLQFNNLVSFDVSFNPLTGKAFKILLEKLNSSQLEDLNLNFTANDIDLGFNIIEFLERGTCEKFRSINISVCCLTDIDVCKIVKNLSKSAELELMEVSNNTNITMQSVQFILQKLNFIKKIYLQGCSKIISSSDFRNITLIQRQHPPELLVLSLPDISTSHTENIEFLKKFWKTCHRDAKYLIRGKHIYFYINDNDLF